MKEQSVAELEIIRYALLQAANEMKIKLMKSSADPLFYESKDFSVALFTSTAEIVAEAPGLPHFLGNMGAAVKVTAEDIGGFDKFELGDIYLNNDPHNATLHIYDMTLISPIFYEEELIAFSSSRAHWTCMGAAEPMAQTNADNMYKEGNLYRSIRLYEKGKPAEQVIKIIRDNSRLPDRSERDLYAQVASCYVGEKRLMALVKKYGKDSILRSMDAILMHGERIARSRIRQIPNGEYKANGYFDNDSINLDVPLKVCVRVVVHEDEMTIDLTGSNPRVRGNTNCGRNQAITECRWAYGAIIEPHISNDGIFRPLHVIIPENSIFDAKKPDATMLGYGVADVAKDLIWTALASVIPTKVCAPNYGQMTNAILYGWWQNEEMWIVVDPQAGGSGGNAYWDGQNAMTFGDLANISVETLERITPIKVERYELRMDSEGPGKNRGGFGLIRDLRFVGRRWSGDKLSKEARSSSLVGRSEVPTWGILGGHSPPPNLTIINPGRPDEKAQSRFHGYPLKCGDVVRMLTSGGGGYGNPLERDVRLVQKDVRDGLVSVKRAKEVYGVLLDSDTYEIDMEGTEKLRSTRSSK